MDRVKKRFRALNTKLSNVNLVDPKVSNSDEDVSATKTTQYVPNTLQKVTSPTVVTFDWESEPFPRASENGKDPPQSPTSPSTQLPSGERREEPQTWSQDVEPTKKKGVYRPPWLSKPEDSPMSVFDLLIDPLVELNTYDHTTQANPKGTPDRKRISEQVIEEDSQSYDLRPPPVPRRYSLGIESTADLLYGESHLVSILKDKKLRGEFVKFLAQRMPSQMVHMVRLSENEKAIAAVTYANAIAQAQRPMTGTQQPAVAAVFSEQFRKDGQRTFGMLLAEALPAYIAYALTNEVMRYMEKQIPRMRTSHMDKQPVKGISEVFCLTDPNMKDHPIIYASKEFFRLTQYGRDYVIGRNCRFLQGPKTGFDSVFRLGRAIRDGREVCETILNYRRDGTPFLNLLLVAPLRDDHGNVKASSRLRLQSYPRTQANSLVQYFLGAQIDVSGIVKDCPGLEAHKRALNHEPPVEPQTLEQAAESIPIRQSSKRTNQRTNGILRPKTEHDRVRDKLRAFLEKLSPDEVAPLRGRDRSQSPTSRGLNPPQPNRKASYKSLRRERQYLSDEDPVLTDVHEPIVEDKPAPTLAGSLPGVYHNYLLVRPGPSLHILFASSALQSTTDLRQTPLLSHISTSVNTLAGLQKAFAQGIPVMGRVVWKPSMKAANNAASGSHNSRYSGHGAESLGTSAAGQSQWLNATPLVGSDDRVGVWVIVILKAPYGSAVGEMF